MTGTNNTMIGLAAEAVGKEDNYAENTGYVYQYDVGVKSPAIVP